MASRQPQIIRFLVKDGAPNLYASVDWKMYPPEIGSEAWVGVCDDLELTAQGRTYSEVCLASQEIQEAYLKILFAEGTLSEFLLDLGWEPKPSLPSDVSADEVVFDVTSKILPQTCTANGS